MKALGKLLAGATVGGAFLALSILNASAAIVCSGDVCWHTHETYRYPPSAHIIIHDDAWKAGPSEHYTFREHEGRGYWHGDTWETW